MPWGKSGVSRLMRRSLTRPDEKPAVWAKLGQTALSASAQKAR